MTELMLLYGFVLWYIIILDLCYILLLFGSLKSIITGYLETTILEVVPIVKEMPLLQYVTVIIPVYNGEDLVVESIYSVLNSKNQEQICIIIVNDGSTDGTLQKIITTFDMHKIPCNYVPKVPVKKEIRELYYADHKLKIILVDKKNGGKSDALNAGLNFCQTDLFITLDHDTLVAPNAIYTLMYNFLHDKDTIAVGGSLSILNGCQYKDGKIIKEEISKNPLCAVQACEYLRSFLYGRAGWASISGSLCYAGAFTLFDYNYVLQIGGFDYNNVAQDFEIITHLQKLNRDEHYKSRLGFAPGAVAWTRVPETLKGYWHQRTNWHMGSLQSLLMHKKMFFNPRYGVIGLVTYPFFFLGEICGSFIIFLGYVIGFICLMFGLVDYYWLKLIFIVSLGLALSMSMATFFLSFMTYNRYKGVKAKTGLFVAAILENLGFRQMLVICEAIAIIRYMLGQRPKITPYP